MNLIAFSTTTHIRSQIPCRDYNALYFLFLNSLRFFAVHSKDYSKTKKTPMSVTMQLPDIISLRNKDSDAMHKSAIPISNTSSNFLRPPMKSQCTFKAKTAERHARDAARVWSTFEFFSNFFRILFGLKNVHNRESDRPYNCNGHLIANSLPRLQRFVFFCFGSLCNFSP